MAEAIHLNGDKTTVGTNWRVKRFHDSVFIDAKGYTGYLMNKQTLLFYCPSEGSEQKARY